MDSAAHLGRQSMTNRMLTLADVLELPVVRRGLPEVVCGADGLGRELRWAHVIELSDPSHLLKGGELVLTTGIGAGAKEADQARWIASLIEQDVAAVAVELGSTWRERVPRAIVRACTEAGMPVVR
jgi:purine catabolism regulator